MNTFTVYYIPHEYEYLYIIFKLQKKKISMSEHF